MPTRPSLVRLIGVGLAAGVLLAALPQPAAAKQDWLGWLEQYSGPGPFHGNIMGDSGIGEISVEFLCLNVSETRSVTTAAMLSGYPALRTFPASIRMASAGLQELARRRGPSTDTTSALAAFEKEKDALLKRMAAGETSLDDSLQRLEAGGNRVLELLRATSEERSQALGEFPQWRNLVNQYTADSIAVPGGLSTGIGRFEPLNVDTKRSFSVLGRNKTDFTKTPVVVMDRQTKYASCHTGRQQQLRAERVTDSTSTSAAIAFARVGDDQGGMTRAISERRDWQTGLVVGVGDYLSHENRIFDSVDSNGRKLVDPQLRVIPLEFLAHAKLSPAIDIGAGVGVAFFHTTFGPDHEKAHTTPAAFYYVPLSVVVRPGALFFPDKRLASVLGYRVSVRRFGELTAADFGNPKGTFKESGEMVWGTSLFVDLFTLFGG